MSEDQTLWRIALDLPDAQVDMFEPVVEDLVESIMWTVDEPRGMQRMEGFTTVQPDAAHVAGVLKTAADSFGVDVPEADIEELAPRDWVAENLKDFPPIDAGRFFIYASHVDERPLAGRIPIRIDPGAAFGTGTHATTSGCLEALEDLGKRHRFVKPLDVGTGSGILAIAMAKMWKLKVLGTDIDPVAIEVADQNAKLNGVADDLDFRVGPGFKAVANYERFDLIVANILARPLTGIAPDFGRALAPGGYGVLSGLIERDERFVLSPYMNQGLVLERRYVRDGWLTLVLKKRG
ncbi:50S ribosomal protein L11 methyltransferase [Magnetovibrio sp. PR-2]|uniref:50S ribosomal protein L11 methyltransferase n=1 Tax=Magnetovibrio sp. PR-2 TaxID=3120356 RepID=UPI002FCE3FE1